MGLNESAQQMSAPRVSVLLTGLALLFVPGVYVVLALSIALSLGVGAGLVYLGWQALQADFPLYVGVLALAAAIGALLGVLAALTGVIGSFLRDPEFKPAALLDMSDEPSLAAIISDLTSRMATKAPDSVVLHAEPVFSVEQGRVVTFDGRADGRVLAIGLPLLYVLNVNELRAVLAHEFAHFTGRDTVYSTVVQPVYAATGTAIAGMKDAFSSIDGFFSLAMALPTVLPLSLLGLYLFLFHLVNMKVSRLREARADAIAAGMCGSGSFKSALGKTAAVSQLFYTKAQQDIGDALANGNTFENYYAEFRDALPALEDQMEANQQAALSEPPDAFDSHSTLEARLGSVPDSAEQYFDRESGAGLLVNLERHERGMTRKLTDMVAELRRAQKASAVEATLGQPRDAGSGSPEPVFTPEERRKAREELERVLEERRKQAEASKE